MNMGHPVFIEQFLHLIRDHVPIVWNGNKRNLLPRFGGWFPWRILSLWLGCIRIRHRNSIHESGMDYILLKGLQRGALGKPCMASRASDEIDCFPDRHCCSEIQVDTALSA